MKDYNNTTFGIACKNKKEMYDDAYQLTGDPTFLKLDQNCENDGFYAYRTLATERKIFMKANAQIMDYASCICYTWKNTLDADCERLISLNPDYEKMFDRVQPKQTSKKRKK